MMNTEYRGSVVFLTFQNPNTGEQSVLMQHRDDNAPTNKDTLCLIGGGCDPGESFLDAILRETREEAMIRLSPRSLRPLGMIPGRQIMGYHLELTSKQLTQIRLGNEGKALVFYNRRMKQHIPISSFTLANVFPAFEAFMDEIQL